MKTILENEARAFLRDQGIPSTKKIDEVVSGFDFRYPTYIRSFEPDEELYQYIRRPSAWDNSPSAGEWFSLKGATTKGLAIIDGNPGRSLHKYRVIRHFSALEGTAKAIKRNWDWAGGGPGGLTQVFVPAAIVRSSMEPVGPHGPF